MTDRMDWIKNMKNDGLREIVLYRMIERAQQELRKGKPSPLAEDMLRIVDDALREEQTRLDREIHVHVAFSSSSAGSLKVALSQCGKRMESRVIQWEDSFSYGPIWNIDQQSGQLRRDQWFMNHFHDGAHRVYMNRETRIDHVMKDLTDIPSDRRIYLWRGRSTHDQVSLRLAMHALRGKTNKIYDMNVSEMYRPIADKYEPELKPDFVGHVPFEALKEMIQGFESAQVMDTATRNRLADDWERLSQTTDTFRIWRNGEIVGLNEAAFDAEIVDTIRTLQLQQQDDHELVENGYVKAGQVVMELMNRKIFESDRYVHYRLLHLIASRKLDFKGIPDAMYLYSVKAM